MNINIDHRNILDEYTNSAPVKLVALAEALGLEVYKSPLKPDVSGLIEPSESARAKFQIRINRYEMAERQRFTLAHEIAHFLLHREIIGGGVVDNVMYRSNLSSRYEVEANKLAADIIMPSPLIKHHLARFGGVASEEAVIGLAEQFRVSQPAMRIRLGA